MSFVDSRFPELDLFLQRWQTRLNTRFLAGEALVAGSVAGLAALIPGFAVDGTPARLALWTAVMLLGAAGYALWKARERLSRHQAASWLDQVGQTQGLFRAASETLDQDEPGVGGQKVLQEADRRRLDFIGRRAPRIPLRRLALRAALALALAAISVFLLVSVAPTVFRPSPMAVAVPPKADQPSAPPESPGTASRELTPQEAAKRLFPEDSRLAALAEQALASGDPGALDTLLQQPSSGSGPAGSRSRDGSPGGNENGPSQQGGQPGEEAGASPSRPPGGQGKDMGSASDPARAQNQGEGPQAGASKKPSDGSGQGSQPPSNPGQRSGGRGAGRPGQSGEAEPNPQIAGGPPGTAHSEAPLRSSVEAGSSDRKIVLKDKENPGIFEYVLPGTGLKVPTAQVLADSRRSAEAIISRTAPPLEFENTIRDYFLSLSSQQNASQPQEVSP